MKKEEKAMTSKKTRRALFSSLLSLLWVCVFRIPKEIVTILNDTLCFPVNFLLNKYWSFKK